MINDNTRLSEVTFEEFREWAEGLGQGLTASRQGSDDAWNFYWLIHRSSPRSFPYLVYQPKQHNGWWNGKDYRATEPVPIDCFGDIRKMLVIAGLLIED